MIEKTLIRRMGEAKNADTGHLSEASIVLDEAFSKSSPAAAARIIEALRAFGLHPLFVTPNKEIALLKSHTRSAILVHNKNQRATLTSLTWEEIEDHARSRKVVEPTRPADPADS